MRIAICEDEKDHARYYAKFVENWSAQTGVSVSLDMFHSAEGFLFHWPEEGSFDLLLLDIQLEKMNGLELAKKIRLLNENLSIIFITGQEQYVYQGYEVSALNYLLKPVKEESLLLQTEQQNIRIKH